MKHYKFHVIVLTIAFVALAGVLLFHADSSRGQSRSGAKGISEVKPTSIIRGRSVSERSSSAFAEAASRNASLRTDLNWIFGGKPQRGWYLYTSLISRLLRTEQDAGSEGFASALSLWQRKSGLAANGILDDTALYAMISEWQGRRLKDRSLASFDRLITASASDFFDNSRDAELRLVERDTYAAYKRLVAAAIADPSLQLRGANGQLSADEKYLKIISAFRTRDYQDKLRKQQPNAGSAGLAVNSPHFTGRALDLYVGGEPVETNDPNRAIQVQTRVYKWLVRNADRFGFRPYYYEPWHWEYVG
jgi:zinc D-Ala-D-Ala carboxypeptidase